ncbi:hypothetical protein TNCT_421841 [Trichonephila clavata]|uniref:Uncharacterized protein n=1 Tax=Trichonephila clavata TaxID=2740835 RepID=A0A8X6HKD2_TRICU|nr:hypothetical protein TNCT_421841 [Trichonephila clavata]
MSKEILVVFNGKRVASCNSSADTNQWLYQQSGRKLESKMDILKSLRIKLRDIRNEYYQVVENDSDLKPLELEILDLEDDCEEISRKE